SRRRQAVPREPLGTVAGDAVDLRFFAEAAELASRRGRLEPHAPVERVGDQQVPFAVERDPVHFPDLGAGGGAAVAGEPERAVARDGVDPKGGPKGAEEIARDAWHGADAS